MAGAQDRLGQSETENNHALQLQYLTEALNIDQCCDILSRRAQTARRRIPRWTFRTFVLAACLPLLDIAIHVPPLILVICSISIQWLWLRKSGNSFWTKEVPAFEVIELLVLTWRSRALISG